MYDDRKKRSGEKSAEEKHYEKSIVVEEKHQEKSVSSAKEVINNQVIEDSFEVSKSQFETICNL